MGKLGEDERCRCMFPSLERCKLKLIYRARKCTMKEGFFCDVLGWLQLFQFSFVYFLCDIVQLFAYLILFSIVWKEFGWVCFDFVRLDLT